jgi:hypothetical protein
VTQSKIVGLGGMISPPVDVILYEPLSILKAERKNQRNSHWCSTAARDQMVKLIPSTAGKGSPFLRHTKDDDGHGQQQFDDEWHIRSQVEVPPNVFYHNFDVRPKRESNRMDLDSG